MCWSYNRQYGTKFLAAMPTNAYGPGDNYDVQNSHVLPTLIRKSHEAKQRGSTQVVVRGTGTPLKLLDVSRRLQALGWTPEITPQQGLRLAYGDFLEQGERK